MEEKSNLLSEQVAKSANNVDGKSGVAKQTCSVIKHVRVRTHHSTIVSMKEDAHSKIVSKHFFLFGHSCENV